MAICKSHLRYVSMNRKEYRKEWQKHSNGSTLVNDQSAEKKRQPTKMTSSRQMANRMRLGHLFDGVTVLCCCVTAELCL